MPVLKDTRKLITVKLDGVEGGEVVVRCGLITSDVEKLTARGGVEAIQSGEMLSYPLSFMIKSWNLTDESGNELPITEENIGILPMTDVYKIYEAATDNEKIVEQDFLAQGAGKDGGITKQQSV